MPDDVDQFKADSWAGTFIEPGRPEGQLVGNLEYSLGLGLVLKAHSPLSKQDISGGARHFIILHGSLDSGKICTLFVQSIRHGFTISAYSVNRYIIDCYCCLFGAHVSQEELFAGLIFKFDSLESFLMPSFAIKDAPTDRDLAKVVVNETESIAIGFSHKSEFVGGDFINRFNLMRRESQDSLRDSLSQIFAAKQADIPVFRTEISPQVDLNFPAGKSLKEALDRAHKIRLLFSILLFEPVRWNSAKVYITNPTDGTRDDFPILYTFRDIVSYRDTISANPVPFQLRSINMQTCDIGHTIKVWDSLSDQYDLLSRIVDNTSVFYTKTDLQGQLVLMLTLMEAINSRHHGKNSQKYSYPIKLADVGGKLQEWIQKVDPDPGKFLDDVRASLLHILKSKQRNYANDVQMINLLCHFLKIVLCSHVYLDCGISRDPILRFQDRYMEGVPIR